MWGRGLCWCVIVFFVFALLLTIVGVLFVFVGLL